MKYRVLGFDLDTLVFLVLLAALGLGAVLPALGQDTPEAVWTLNAHYEGRIDGQTHAVDVYMDNIDCEAGEPRPCCHATYHIDSATPDDGGGLCTLLRSRSGRVIGSEHLMDLRRQNLDLLYRIHFGASPSIQRVSITYESR